MTKKISIILGLFSLLILTSCGSQNQASPAAQSVEGYIQALVSQDSDRIRNLSCADWEERAILELDSFESVKTKLENLACQESGTQGEFTLVNCQGKIIASYGAEDQELDLSVNTYLAIEEGGEWRMCGYP